MRSMLMELKKPQASDITPIFRLTKARKKSTVIQEEAGHMTVDELKAVQRNDGSGDSMDKV